MLIAMMFVLMLLYHFLTSCTKTTKHLVEVHDTVYTEKVVKDSTIEQSVKTDTIYKVRTDTIHEFKTYRDSVLVRDSVYVREKGDSVYIYKEKWNTRVELKHDTVYKAKTDTAWMTHTDTLVVYRFMERGDSTYISKDKDEVKVKEKTGLWKRLTLVGVLLAVCGVIVWLIRKKGL